MRGISNWLTAALVLVVAGGAPFAQPRSEGSAAAAEADGDATAPALSAAEMRKQGAAMAEQVVLDMRHTLVLREKVRKQLDVIKLTCVNDKLIQMKARQNLFDTARDQLDAAMASGAADDRALLFASLSTEAERVHSLREEADVCVGESELSSETSSVFVDSPEIPDDPTTMYPIEPGVEPPGYASPFR